MVDVTANPVAAVQGERSIADDVRRQKFISLVLAVLLFITTVVLVTSPNAGGSVHLETGRFTGFNMSQSAIIFQPNGSTAARSFAWSASTPWLSTDGTWHSGSPAPCVTAATIGRRLSIGVVDAKPVGSWPGAVLLVEVKC